MLMFKCFNKTNTTIKPTSYNHLPNPQNKTISYRRSSVLFVSLLTGTLSITACQPTSINDKDNKTQSALPQEIADKKPVRQSDAAAEKIAEFQPLYVTQMQSLQRRLQAEYESLEAADATENNIQSHTKDTDTATSELNTEKTTTTDSVPLNTSTEVGERDLEVLKSLSLDVKEPILITEDEIIKRYQQAMDALYLSNATALEAQHADTLLNIATLTPQVFEYPELAERLTIKSPALGRLIIQYQVWQQIEVQHALDMQQMKETQQQEFDGLMTKFDDTIKGYDEQIAKYEENLKTINKK